MKSGNGKIFLALLVISLVLIAMLDTSYLFHYVWTGPKVELPDKPPVQFSLPVKDFEGIRVANGWTVTIRKGNEYKVQVTLPENCRPALATHIEPSSNPTGVTIPYLVVGFRGATKVDENRKMLLDITMPVLKCVRACGGANVTVSGFAKDDVVVYEGWGAVTFN